MAGELGRDPAGDPGASIVTLDGPAGVGKSTTARAVARELGYRYLDSGALYRSVTHALLESGVPPERWPGLDRAALDGLGIRVTPRGETLEIRWREQVLDAELRTEAVTARVSEVARVPAVRKWLHRAQRSAAREGRLVADGRDMGTVVFPEARTKVFLTAEVEERARRRLGDRGVPRPGPGEVSSEVDRLSRRDEQDRNRDVAPLRVPDDAVVLDTTHLTFREQVERIVGLARKATESRVDGSGSRD